MLVCPVVKDKFVEDHSNDHARVDAFDRAEQDIRRLNELVAISMEHGRYRVPSEGITPAVDVASLVGKVVSFEAVDEYTFTQDRVKTAVLQDGVFVLINGKHMVDTRNNMTTDGMHEVTFGSEEKVDTNGKQMLKELSGSLVEQMDEMFKVAAEYDGEEKADQVALAKSVMDRYKTVLMEAGKDIVIDAKFYAEVEARLHTRGTVAPDSGKLSFILSGRGTRSATEIVAHEVQHLLISKVIEQNPWLKKDIEALRTATKSAIEAMAKDITEKAIEAAVANGVDPKTVEATKPSSVFLVNNKVGPDGKYLSEDMLYADTLWNYVFEDGSNPVDEFLAFATTNLSLVGVIESVKTYDTTETVDEETGEVVSSKQEKRLLLITPFKGTGALARFANAIINGINAMFSSKSYQDKNMHEMALDLLDMALAKGYQQNAEAEMERGRIGKIIDKIDSFDERMANMGKKRETAMAAYERYLLSQKESDFDRATAMLWRIHSLAKLRNWAVQKNLFGSITRAVGNPDFAEFYERFRQGVQFVEREVNALKQSTAKTYDEDYEFDKFDKPTRAAIKRVLFDTDSVVLGTTKTILEYLENKSIRDSEIEALTEGFDPAVVERIRDLARLIVTNKAEGRNPYVNAAQIAVLEVGVQNGDTIRDIDKAATLMAMNMLTDMEVQLAVEAIKKNETGITRALWLKKSKDKSILKQAYGNNLMYQVKGAMQQRSNEKLTHKWVDENAMKDHVKAGYTNLGEHAGLSELTGKKMYMVVGKQLDGAYTEGLMKVVQLKNEGDSVRKLLMEWNPLMDEEAIADSIALIIEGVTDTGWRFIPERDGNGKIYDYRIRIPNDVKGAHLGVDNDIVSALASTASNFTHKEHAMSSNRSNLRYLNKLYDKYKDNKKYLFIEINENSKGRDKEYWDLLPYYLKGEIKRGPNKGSLFIEQTMLVDYFGYKDINLADTAWVRNKTKRKVVAKYIQELASEVAKKWKKDVVAFTEETIEGNMGSNMLIAIQEMKDKNPLNYLKKFQKFWVLLNEYQVDRAELLRLRIRYESGDSTVTMNKLKGLERKMEQNLVHPLMKDGQYSGMLEDISTDYFETKGNFEEWFDSKIDGIKKDKTRVAVKAVFDNLYARKDAVYHDTVMKATTYSDAINKLIILYDMVENSKDKKITQSMLNFLDQMHVNYTYLDNKWVKLLNDILILTFTKYLFRAFPVFLRMLHKKSGTMAVTEIAQEVTGIDLVSPIDAYYHPIDSIFNRAGLALRPTDVGRDIAFSWWPF